MLRMCVQVPPAESMPNGMLVVAILQCIDCSCRSMVKNGGILLRRRPLLNRNLGGLSLQRMSKPPPPPNNLISHRRRFLKIYDLCWNIYSNFRATKTHKLQLTVRLGHINHVYGRNSFVISPPLKMVSRKVPKKSPCAHAVRSRSVPRLIVKVQTIVCMRTCASDRCPEAIHGQLKVTNASRVMHARARAPNRAGVPIRVHPAFHSASHT